VFKCHKLNAIDARIIKSTFMGDHDANDQEHLPRLRVNAPMKHRFCFLMSMF